MFVFFYSELYGCNKMDHVQSNLFKAVCLYFKDSTVGLLVRQVNMLGRCNWQLLNSAFVEYEEFSTSRSLLSTEVEGRDG